MNNSPREPFPPVPQSLVDALREAFPTRPPTSGQDLRYYDELVGVERVLAFLEAKAQLNKRRR